MVSIGFHGSDSKQCGLCGATVDREPLREVEFGVVPYPEACPSCWTRFMRGARPLELRPRSFETSTEIRKVGLRGEDLREIATWILERCAPSGAPPLPTGEPEALARLESLRQELSGAVAAPADEVPPRGERGSTTAALAAGLVAAAMLRIELLPGKDVDRLLMRIDHREVLELLFALHCHARAVRSRLAPGKVRRADPAATALLERATRGYLVGGPPPGLDWSGRLEVLQAELEIEAGQVDAAGKRLLDRGQLRGAGAATGITDPRAALLYGVVLVLQSQVAAADRQFAYLASWFESADRTAWRDVEAALQHNRYVRATARRKQQNWDLATAALQRYVILCPDDAAARFELAHAFLARSLDPVAREILGSVFDRDARAVFRDCYQDLERRGEGVFLYGSCLLRVAQEELARGEEAQAEVSRRQALEVIEAHLDAEDGPDGAAADPWRGSLLGLQALCSYLAGDLAAALRQFQEAATRDRAAARDGWAVLLGLLHEALGDDGPDPESAEFAELLELLAGVGGLVRTALGARHRAMLARELVVILGLGTRGSQQLDLSFGPGLASNHPDGACWLAYQRWGQKSFVQAWSQSLEAEGMGAVGVPFRLLQLLTARAASWPESLRQAVGSVLLPCLVTEPGQGSG